MTIKEWLQTDQAKEYGLRLWRHVYSFSKTFFTIFIALYAKDAWESAHTEVVLFDWPLIIINAKWALIAIVRNVWKIGTEK